MSEDEWLGSLFSFPTALHARASFVFDMSIPSLQKGLVSALSILRSSSVPFELSISDDDGYQSGKLRFEIGVGNGEAFDILDADEEQRLLGRIENMGPFSIIDLALHLRYVIEDNRSHKIHRDHYVVRLVFQPGGFEMLIHHVKGLRRVDPAEIVQLILQRLNAELVRNGLLELQLASVHSG